LEQLYNASFVLSTLDYYDFILEAMKRSKREIEINVGVILAGGTGKRFQSKIPKQFMILNGKMVAQYAIDAMKESGVIDYIIVVVVEGWSDYIKNLNYVDKIVIGGKERTDSVRNALLACPKNTRYVLFHDATRPFVKKEHIQNCIRELQRGAKFVGTVELVVDALVETDDNFDIVGVLDRDRIRLHQTPAGFDYRLVLKYYKDLKRNDYVMIAEPLIEDGIKGKALVTPDINMKITYSRDLIRAEQMIKYRPIVKRAPNVEGKRILLFGGSGGIGKEIKRQLEKLGATVCAPSRKEFDLNKFPFDHWLYDEKFDCIIHAAGAYARDEEGLMANYEQIMGVNFKSVVQIAEIAPIWLPNGGNIVLVGSSSATKGRKNISIYSASKAALNAFVEAYSEKLIEKNIKVNVVCPAKVATRLQRRINPQADPSQMMQPEDIANIIIRYCDVDFTGHVVYVKAGLEDVS